MRTLKGTIDENLEALNEVASALLAHNPSLALEAHRIYVDLKEGIADLRGEYCNCDQCECDTKDDYTKDGNTCEECFRDCHSTEGGE